MAHEHGDEFKEGQCKWCGDDGAVYADSGYCEDCDRDIVHCHICDRDTSREYKCRHVFEDENFEWCGSGTDHLAHDGIKRSFFDLLSQMPTEFARELAPAIRTGKFHTWLIAPMIGGGGLLELGGFATYVRGRSFGDRLLELGASPAADELADGYRWLVSLYCTDTPAANELTIRWIADWEDMKDVLRMQDDGCRTAPDLHHPR